MASGKSVNPLSCYAGGVRSIFLTWNNSSCDPVCETIVKKIIVLTKSINFIDDRQQHHLPAAPLSSPMHNSISKSMMLPWRLGEGDEAYYTYVEEADDDANKGSA
jgi:hypothetical protein